MKKTILFLIVALLLGCKVNRGITEFINIEWYADKGHAVEVLNKNSRLTFLGKNDDSSLVYKLDNYLDFKTDSMVFSFNEKNELTRVSIRFDYPKNVATYKKYEELKEKLNKLYFHGGTDAEFTSNNYADKAYEANASWKVIDLHNWTAELTYSKDNNIRLIYKVTTGEEKKGTDKKSV